MKKNKILVLGGYGGNNVGDDAQLAGSLELLKKHFPDLTLVVLTPDLKQTFLRHQVEAVGLASRNALFDFDVKPEVYVQWWKPENKKWLHTRYNNVIENVKRYLSGKDFKLSKRQLSFCNNLKDAKLIYYVGGGYLMGPTASRLWDAALVAEIAELYRVPLVFSGHNIGLWENQENKDFARKLFKSSPLITTRDRTFSKKELEEIGICGAHIYETCDDALFLDTTASSYSVNLMLEKYGLKKEGFVALSFHDASVIKKLWPIFEKNISKPILIIPTCPPDVNVQKEFCELNKDKARLIRVEKLLTFEETKELFSRAFYTISTRHHPLIFSMSSGVPCMSINVTKYFSNKNFGALELCNIGDFCLDKDSDGLLSLVERKIRSLEENRLIYSKLITESLFRVRHQRQIFVDDLKVVLNN